MSSLKVLAIDDDRMDLAMIRRITREVEGFKIELSEHSNAKDGVASLEVDNIDALLLDYELGPCSGLEVLTELRERGHDIPVIMLTGHDHTDVAVSALKTGASDFLAKGRLSAKRLERSLVQVLEKSRLQRQVDEQRKLIEKRNAELELFNRNLRDFCHHVAHELKNPLTSTHEFISIVLDGIGGEVTDDQREYLSIALQGCSQLERQINDLLDFSRVETGKLRLEKEECDLAEVVRSAVNAIGPAIYAANHTVEAKLPGDSIRAVVDAGRVRQILDNLIANAIKFTEAPGVIRVELHDSAGDFHVIAVEDNGCGIAKDDTPLIFDRLFQVASSDEGGSGLGLGLALCQEIAAQHGGELKVVSELGVGSRFEVWLPKSDAS